MQCKTCKRPMLALFTSYVCDYCDGHRPAGTFRGYVVIHRPLPSQEYVFKTQADAERWRRLNRHEGAVVRPCSRNRSSAGSRAAAACTG
jgi:hypothetical protein